MCQELPCVGRFIYVRVFYQNTTQTYESVRVYYFCWGLWPLLCWCWIALFATLALLLVTFDLNNALVPRGLSGIKGPLLNKKEERFNSYKENYEKFII